MFIFTFSARGKRQHNRTCLSRSAVSGVYAILCVALGAGHTRNFFELFRHLKDAARLRSSTLVLFVLAFIGLVKMGVFIYLQHMICPTKS